MTNDEWRTTNNIPNSLVNIYQWRMTNDERRIIFQVLLLTLFNDEWRTTNDEWQMRRDIEEWRIIFLVLLIILINDEWRMTNNIPNSLVDSYQWRMTNNIPSSLVDSYQWQMKQKGTFSLGHLFLNIAYKRHCQKDKISKSHSCGGHKKRDIFVANPLSLSEDTGCLRLPLASQNRRTELAMIAQV